MEVLEEMTLKIAKQTAQQGNHLNYWLNVTFRRILRKN
jgi:hypothetical protein